MHPQNTIGPFWFNVKFVISSEELLASLVAYSEANTTLLRVLSLHVLAAFGKFVLETGHEALIQMVICDCIEYAFVELLLIEHLTDNDSIYSDASLASKVHHTRVCIALLEKQMFVVEINELILDVLHSFFNAFKHEIVPVWTQSKQLSEV